MFKSNKFRFKKTIESTSKKKVNFIFVRHGYGCHNAASGLYKKNMITYEQTQIVDPELTDVGVDATIYNGCIIANRLREMGIQKIHMVGTSPLIRSMETAHFLTTKWKTPPEKIYVFPYLRELDESTLHTPDDHINIQTIISNQVQQKNKTYHLKKKFSRQSRNVLNQYGAYAMKPIAEQQQYLRNVGLLDKISFRYNGGELREEPGDIDSFIDWFQRNSMTSLIDNTNDTVNILVVTHAGVLLDFYLTAKGEEHSFFNNSGVVVNCTFNLMNFKIDSVTPIELPPTFFKDYDTTKSLDYFCPSQRCHFCTNVKNKISKPIKNINDKLDTKECNSLN